MEPFNIIQVVTMAISLATFIVFAMVAEIEGKVPRQIWGVMTLCGHIIIFYLANILAVLGIFSFVDFVNNLSGHVWFSAHVWSSCIRLQMMIELFIMSLSVYRARGKA